MLQLQQPLVKASNSVTDISRGWKFTVTFLQRSVLDSETLQRSLEDLLVSPLLPLCHTHPAHARPKCVLQMLRSALPGGVRDAEDKRQGVYKYLEAVEGRKPFLGLHHAAQQQLERKNPRETKLGRRFDSIVFVAPFSSFPATIFTLKVTFKACLWFHLLADFTAAQFKLLVIFPLMTRAAALHNPIRDPSPSRITS